MGTFEHTELTENHSGFQAFHSYWEHIDNEKNERYFFEVLSVAKDGIFIKRNMNSFGISQGYDEFAKYYKKNEPSLNAPSDADLNKLFEILKKKEQIIAEYRARYKNDAAFEKKSANVEMSRESDARNIIIGVLMKEHKDAEKLAEIQPYSIENIIISSQKSLLNLIKENNQDKENNKFIGKVKAFFGINKQI